ncbi:tetratricopeptide repeat protein [Rhodoflexus sp.]
MELHERLEAGIIQSRNGNHLAAIELFEAILKQAGEYVPALYHIGYNHFLMQRFELAMYYYERALAIEPNNPHIISQKGVLLFHQNRKEESLLAMNQAQALEPENPYRYSSRAFIKDAMGDIHGAIADYQRALELDPEDAICLNNLGMLEEKLGYKEAAKKRFIRADELAEKLGYTFKNTPPQAAEDAEKLANQQPDTTQPGGSSAAEKPTASVAEVQTESKAHKSALLPMMWQILTDAQLRAEFGQFIIQKLGFAKK